MALGSWNQIPNFLEAIRAGAGLGAQLRGQDIAESEAGDRLQLAYDQLATQEREASERARLAHENQRAALALRAEQQSSMEQYRRDQIKAREQQLGQAASAAQALQDYRNRTLTETGARNVDTALFHDRMATAAEERAGIGSTPFSPTEVTLPSGRQAAQLGPRRFQLYPDPDLWMKQTDYRTVSSELAKTDPSDPRYAQLLQQKNQLGNQLKIHHKTKAKAATQKPGKVYVTDPDGNPGWIPEGELDQAIEEGYSPVED